MNTKYDMNSKVEAYFKSQKEYIAIDKNKEKTEVFTFDNYVLLGQAIALRFIEWIQLNPQGVVALPTGKTPEFFIKWVNYYFENWTKEIKSGLPAKIGLLSTIPTCKELKFIQLDEFFPMNPTHERSFHYFVNKFYIQGFGFEKKNAMLIDAYNISKEQKNILGDYTNLQEIFPDGKIDLSLRIKHPSSKIEEIQKKTIKLFDQFCEDYEESIRQMGGIGFFLGGIGPDGHIAFNVKGSSHHSHTRLTNINYETQAAAASDLGGIESVRKKAVITIGLETITYNPNTVALIMAAGESKSKIISDAIQQNPSLEYPASVLQKLPNARFYLTNGAANQLTERKHSLLKRKKVTTENIIDKLIIDGTIENNMSLTEVINKQASNIAKDNENWKLASELTGEKIEKLAEKTYKRIIEKIENGIHLPKDKRFLHTAPHHDDIELAYFPLLHHLVRSEFNDNHFTYCTSGFTAVTNDYVLENLTNLKNIIKTNLLCSKLNLINLLDINCLWDDVTGALNSIAQQSTEDHNYFFSARLARQLFFHAKIKTVDDLLFVTESQIQILKKLEPGSKEPELIQLIKGWFREFEAELVWAHFGIGTDHVRHLRLKFYSGDIFVEYPDFNRDVMPIIDTLEKVKPSIISLALDPEGSGPDTHFKTLIALADALEKYVEKHKQQNIRIWGYRNIWSRFHPADVSMIVPVSLNSFAVLHNMFNNCFVSQKSASFPSYEYEGTFSELAQKIWVSQHNDLMKLIGNEFFYDNPNPMIKRSYGAIYLKDMSYPDFCEEIKFIKEMIHDKLNLK